MYCHLLRNTLERVLLYDHHAISLLHMLVSLTLPACTRIESDSTHSIVGPAAHHQLHMHASTGLLCALILLSDTHETMRPTA